VTRRDHRSSAVGPGALASAMGRGIAAGLAGTAAMTAVMAAESALIGRAPSTRAGRSASRFLGVAAVDGPGERRFNRFVHWAYGVCFGGVRGLLAGCGLRARHVTLLHLAMVWTPWRAVLRATKSVDPHRGAGPTEVLVDGFNHVVYASVTGFAYTWLDRH
jgi:hypothetical protein